VPGDPDHEEVRAWHIAVIAAMDPRGAEMNPTALALPAVPRKEDHKSCSSIRKPSQAIQRLLEE
jgi:hypothetical protein